MPQLDNQPPILSKSSRQSVAGMTVERARVIAVEPVSSASQGALWVEVFQTSTCGQCEAKSTCGQGVLSRWFGRGSHCLRVLYEDRQAELFSVGQWVEIGVPDGVVLRASFIAYLLPIISMIIVAALFDGRYHSDLSAVIGGIIGFALGFWFVRHYERKHFNRKQSQPQLLGAANSQ